MGNEYYPVRPHEAQDKRRIAAGSPLAVLGIFIETLRERFGPQANLGLVWKEDLQTTDIAIEAGYNVEAGARDVGRGLYINRLNASPQQIAIADRVGVHLPDHMEGFTCMMQSQITIDCISSDAGESAILADIVQSFFIGSRQIFCAMYGFHDFGLAEMAQTLPYENDQQKFITTVSLVVQFQARWTTVKIRPLLQGVGVRMAADNVAQAFENTAVTSLQRVSASVEQIATACGGDLITLEDIDPGLIDPSASMPGLRTLGTGAQQALPGNTPLLELTAVLPAAAGAAPTVGIAGEAARADHVHDLQEGGGQHLTLGPIPDAQLVTRSGTALVGTTAPDVTRIGFVTIADPTPPTSTVGQLYASSDAGRVTPRYQNAVEKFNLQRNIGDWTVMRALPGVAGGTPITAVGQLTPVGYSSAFGPQIAEASIGGYRTQIRRFYVNGGTASTTNHSGVRSGALQYWRGNAAGQGGFYWSATFAFGSIGATHQAFAGLIASAANFGTSVVPSAQVRCVALGFDSGDANCQILHNDGVGTCTKIPLGASFAKNTTAAVYRVVFWCPPNASTIGYSVTRLDTGATASGTLSADLPASTDLLAWHIYQNVGGATETAFVEVMRQYSESP